MALSTIDNLSIGLNPDEIKTFLQNEIKTGVIENAKEKLEGSKYNEFIDELEKNWAGKAKQDFEEKLNESLEGIRKLMDTEYENIYYNFATLVDNFKEEDENMIGNF